MMKQQNATETAVPKLPVFNQTISIEVSLDDIYRKLMGTFPEDYKHKEILSHAIVGSAMEYGGIGFIYNALNGYTNDVDFKVGDIVVCTSQDRKVYTSVTEEGKRPDWNWRAIGDCQVIEINMYKRSKLRVEFQQINSEGKSEVTSAWVDHKKCTKQAQEKVSVQPINYNV